MLVFFSAVLGDSQLQLSYGIPAAQKGAPLTCYGSRICMQLQRLDAAAAEC